MGFTYAVEVSNSAILNLYRQRDKARDEQGYCRTKAYSCGCHVGQAHNHHLHFPNRGGSDLGCGWQHLE